MFTLGNCNICGGVVVRSYNLSAARKAKPLFCGDECFRKHAALKSESESASKFWRMVDIGAPNDCWRWTGHIHNGYGWVNRRGKTQNASRLAWALHHERAPPADKEVCHSCDNPSCCNPAHLWLGTHAENVADMDAKNRANRCGVPTERHPKRKLTLSQAIEAATSKTSASELGRKFGVTATAIYNVRHGKAWSKQTGIVRT
jgi:hypothetical protein